MISRRSFVRNVTVALPVVTLPACAEAGPPAQIAAATLDAERLRALAEVLLPSELGSAGLDAATAGFARWVADYRPAAEREHGYGTDEIAYTSPHPGPGWAAQLEAFELEAMQRHGTGFAALSREARTAMVQASLTRERSVNFPAPAEAHAVALGFLAWFYASPEANDLCHGVAIRTGSCRPLAELAARPAARAQGG